MINLFTLPLITIFLLSLQAIFAGSEIALLSCDKAKIREKADSGNSATKLVTQSINRIEEYVSGYPKENSGSVFQTGWFVQC